VRRFRWFAEDSDDHSGPVEWRSVAVVLATLFLNFSFCQDYGLQLWGFGPLGLDACFARPCDPIRHGSMFHRTGPRSLFGTAPAVCSTAELSRHGPNCGPTRLLYSILTDLDREADSDPDIMGPYGHL